MPILAVLATLVSSEALAKRVTLGMKVGIKKRVVGPTDGENCMTLWLLVLTQYQRVTDGRTDMDGQICRSSITERAKNCLPNRIQPTEWVYR